MSAAFQTFKLFYKFIDTIWGFGFGVKQELELSRFSHFLSFGDVSTPWLGAHFQ